jgi:hypothetical protein
MITIGEQIRIFKEPIEGYESIAHSQGIGGSRRRHSKIYVTLWYRTRGLSTANTEVHHWAKVLSQ